MSNHKEFMSSAPLAWLPEMVALGGQPAPEWLLRDAGWRRHWLPSDLIVEWLRTELLRPAGRERKHEQ